MWVVSEDESTMHCKHPLCTPVAFERLRDILEPKLKVGSEVCIQAEFCFLTYEIEFGIYEITSLPARLSVHRSLACSDAASLTSFRSTMTDLVESVHDEVDDYRDSHPIQPCDVHFCTVINVLVKY